MQCLDAAGAEFAAMDDELADREIEHPFTKDSQITAIRGARHYLGDKLIRVAPGS